MCGIKLFSDELESYIYHYLLHGGYVLRRVCGRANIGVTDYWGTQWGTIWLPVLSIYSLNQSMSK